MAGSTISTFMTVTVELDGSSYASPLKITSTGTIAPEYSSDHPPYTDGIDVADTITNATILNYGHIVTGTYPRHIVTGIAGGTNLFLRNAGAIYSGYGVTMGGTLVNSGSIGGNHSGVVFGAGSLSNSGIITGAYCGVALDGNDSLLNSATGKISGILVNGSGASIINRGYISPVFDSFFQEGVIAYSQGARITNSGTISGGIAIGGTATIVNTGTILDNCILASDSTLKNSGYIYSPSSGYIYLPSYGVSLTRDMLTNTGTIIGDTAIKASGSTIKNSGTISGVLAVSLTGGMLTNSGAIYGGVRQYGGTIINSGTISQAAHAIAMYGGSLTNTGVILGNSEGVIVGPNTTGGSLTNLGTISGATGAALVSGSLENKKDIFGTIGVEVSGGSLVNAHDIYGQTIGLEVTGGSATNTGHISAVTGVSLSGGSVANSGKISGTADGVSLSGGTLFNTGDITGQAYGVTISGGTLITGGTIEGKLDAVHGEAIQLVVDPGAVFQGKVTAKGSDNSLEFGAGLGTLSGVGSRLLGFDEITFATGSTWTLEGTKAGLTTGQQIYGFTTGDRIVLDGFTAQSDHFVNGIGLILGSHGGVTETIGIYGALHTADFTVTSLHDHTTITVDAASSNAAKMAFLSPSIGGHGVSPAAISPADLFADTRSPKYSASYLSKAVNLAPAGAAASATLSALHGFGPATTATDAAAHDAKVISIPTFGI